MSEDESKKPRVSRTPEQESARRTRRAFVTLGIGAAVGYGGWTWLRSTPQIGEEQWPIRRMLDFNERLADAYFSDSHLAPTFPPDRVEDLRANGDVGLGNGFDPADWSLTVKPLAGSDPVRRLTMADIKALPKVEYTTQFKCVEGWSIINQFAGARFSDFTRQFAPQSAQARYVSMQTPDEMYFVGLDMASALHPQTLLCYEMNGEPLTSDHGAPLRLAIPVKYGLKNIKRIGMIAYMNDRPPDYWAEEGYDWYDGL
ncbi:MAG TPA: molybdopterin-dependent oxidoreductase [Bryobacteraceae bacterium]|nr:molybdopterin-dependent oxidoreductase [Bryobacteraceae bacterium]